MPANMNTQTKQIVKKKYISVFCEKCDTHFNVTTDCVGMVLKHNECGNNFIIVQDDEYKIIYLSKMQNCDT